MSEIDLRDEIERLAEDGSWQSIEIDRLRDAVAARDAVIDELRKLDEWSSSPDWPGWNALTGPRGVWAIIRSAPKSTRIEATE